MRPPAAVERFVKQLNVAYRAVKLYPGSSGIPRENAAAAIEILRLILRDQPFVRFAVGKDALTYEDAGVFPATAPFTVFAREFYSRHVAEVRFHAGCTDVEVVSLLSLLAQPPETLAATGGFEGALWNLGVVGISVTETAVRIVDHEADEAETEGSWPPEPERINQLLDDAVAGRVGDQRLLVRFLSDRAALRGYLRAYADGGGSASVQLAGRIGAIARSVASELPDQREALLRGLAEAILDMDPEDRRDLMVKRLLGTARKDEAVANIVRQMSLGEVMEAILHDVKETPAAREGLSRAIRNLAFISVRDTREAVLGSASQAMAEHGLSESFSDAVLESAAPRRLEAERNVRSSEAKPVESVLRLLDVARVRAEQGDGAHEVEQLTAEAQRGLTDGDVLSALVAIATLETRAAQFASVMALLEDSVGLLIEAHEFEVAADAAESLTAAADDPSIEAAHRRRMRELLKLLARPEAMRMITEAMRVYRFNSAEHAACRRLLAALGSQSVGPMLEALADEPDMAARKAIVDMMAGMADRFIPELGASLGDRRWYFVRNVISILAATRDARILPYLERTLRHADPRVRRETLRAVSGVRDVRSERMLIAGLSDEDASNVTLAARYLGALGCENAVAPLGLVARGEGRTKRDPGPRVEAIEALGRIATPSAISALQDVARQRGLRSARTREVRAAAEAAITAITARGDQGLDDGIRSGAGSGA